MNRKSIKAVFALFLILSVLLTMCVPVMAASHDAYVTSLSISSDTLLDLLQKKYDDWTMIKSCTNITGGGYSEKKLSDAGTFDLAEDVEYTIRVKVVGIVWTKKDKTIKFHIRKAVTIDVNETANIDYYEGIAGLKEQIFSKLYKSSNAELSASNVTVMYDATGEGGWTDIEKPGDARKFGTLSNEKILLKSEHKSDSSADWSDQWLTGQSAVCNVTLVDPRQATHFEITGEIPTLEIGSNYADILKEYLYLVTDDGKPVEDAAFSFTINGGKNITAAGAYPVKAEYAGIEGKYLPAYFGNDDNFIVNFNYNVPNYTARLDQVGSGTVQIERNGSVENFDCPKMLTFTNNISDGFKITATPTANSGYYTAKIVAKNGSKIVAQAEKQNTLEIPEGKFENGDVCTVYVTFSEASISFNRYVSLHNKTKITEGASKSACKKAIFDAAYIISEPENLTVNDVSMEMERDVWGFVDFDDSKVIKANYFGKRDKETVKIYYKYNGKSLNKTITVSFYLTPTEMIVPAETIILNETPDYDSEIKSKLAVKVKNGDILTDAAINLSGLDTALLNKEQTIAASYDGVSGDIDGCSANVNVKIIPSSLRRTESIISADNSDGKLITINFANYSDSFNGDAILAAYDESGKLCEVKKIGDLTLDYGITPLTFNFSATDFASFKFFIWDSLEGMNPQFMKPFLSEDIVSSDK